MNESGDIERAVAAGCDDFLSKPVNKFELLKRVQIMLKLRQVTDELERLRRYIDGMEEDDGPSGKEGETGRRGENTRTNERNPNVESMTKTEARKGRRHASRLRHRISFDI